jgi:fumarate hydratase subunit alpha
VRIISFETLKRKVKEAVIEANYVLTLDMRSYFEDSLMVEESPGGKETLRQLLENARIAEEERIPLCQDTGLAVFFVEMGAEVRLQGGSLTDAIQGGVRDGYAEGFLRKSVCHPFSRANTGDNTPAIIHLEIVPGEELKIYFSAKGGGSENMSRAVMLNPSDGIAGVEDFVVGLVDEAQANPCPPIIVGVGIGGNLERSAILAKKALVYPRGKTNKDPLLAAMETRLLQRINSLGIGPAGLGGKVTALAVQVLMEPCHIASLPVAVNLNCHANRHREIIL